MSDTAESSSPVAQAINEDLTCRRCGYNLRGLTLDKVCPECGTPISHSVHGNLLRWADPDWLDNLRRGALLKLWNMLIVLVVSVAFGVLVGVGAVPQTAGALPALIAGILDVLATFLLTSPEPAIAFEEDPVTLRKLVRVCVIANLVGSTAQQAAQNYRGSIPLVVLGAVFSLVGLVALFGLFVYLRRFALRIPDDRLAKQTAIVMWGYGSATCLGVAMALVVTTMLGVVPGMAGAAPGTAIPAGAAWVGAAVFGCFVGVAGTVFTIWYIVLMFRYHSVFRLAATEARQTLIDRPCNLKPPSPQDGASPPSS